MDESFREYYDMINNAQQQNNAWSAEQAQKAMEYQTEMSNTAHQREVADLKAAGLNPVLSAGGQGATTGTGHAAQAGNENVQALYGLVSKALDAQIEQADAMKTSAKAASGHAGNSKPIDMNKIYSLDDPDLSPEVRDAVLRAKERLKNITGFTDEEAEKMFLQEKASKWLDNPVLAPVLDYIKRRTGISPDHLKGAATSLVGLMADYANLPFNKKIYKGFMDFDKSVRSFPEKVAASFNKPHHIKYTGRSPNTHGYGNAKQVNFSANRSPYNFTI